MATQSQTTCRMNQHRKFQKRRNNYERYSTTVFPLPACLLLQGSSRTSPERSPSTGKMQNRKTGAPRPEPASLSVSESHYETAAAWAAQQRTWIAQQADVLRGFSQRLDWRDIMIRVLLCFLGMYSVYLMYCESCKDEYRALFWTVVDGLHMPSLQSAAQSQIVRRARGYCLAPHSHVDAQRAPVLVDFKTYRHKSAGSGEANTAGERVEYDKFLAVSKSARHLDGSACFERSMEFQERFCAHRASARARSSALDLLRRGDRRAAQSRLPLHTQRRREAELMMFKAVEEVLASTKTRPERSTYSSSTAAVLPDAVSRR